MKKKTTPSMETLEGIVTASAWDESDQVCEVSLSATDDEDYRIENYQRFLDLVKKPIRAVGLVKRGKKMHRTINIKKFEMLDNAFEEENGHEEKGYGLLSPNP